MEPFIGQIILFGGDFPPRGWAFCDGQLLLIADNTGLFSILGTKYGGDGHSTYGLPDLRGRVAVNPGKGPGLSDVKPGEIFGNNSTTLVPTNLPCTSINMPYSSDASTGESKDFARVLTTENTYTKPSIGNDSIKGGTDGQTNQAFSNRPPSLGVYYIIALKGIYPSRNF